MYKLIESYINILTKEEVNNFAKEHGANLNNEELDFTYKFIKNNWQDILKKDFDLNKYKNFYQEKNFLKVKEVFNEYYQRFHRFL